MDVAAALAAPPTRPVGSTFGWRGRTLAYEELGDGPQVVVLLHGLLMDSRSNRGTARRLVAPGRRVVSLDLLGHGASDHPAHAAEHRMDVYAEQVIALLDHIGAPSAVLVGTSLGANVALFAAVRHPERVDGLVLEMPVLEWAVPPAAMLFAPLLLAVHYAAPLVRAVGRAVRALPAGPDLLASALGPATADPEATAAVLHGILVGPVAPTVDERRTLEVPALVIGHRADLIHPFTDASRLAGLLPRARLVQAVTALELRVWPRRLVGEMDDFLEQLPPSVPTPLS